MRSILFHSFILICLLLTGASCQVLDESAQENPHEFLIVEAEARVTDYLPQRLEIVATVQNTHPFKGFDFTLSCPEMLARLYPAEGGLTDTPVWREEDGLSIGCPATKATTGYASPSQTVLKRFSISVKDLLDNDLPEDSYQAAAMLTINGAPTPDIPAGPVTLSAPSAPIPQGQLVDGILYRADLLKVLGDTTKFRVEITMTNQRDVVVKRQTPPPYETGPCPFGVWGYRTEQQRDTYYAQRFADWIPYEIRVEKRCLLMFDDFALEPGASKTFSAIFLPPRGPGIPLPQYMMVRVDVPLAANETQQFYLSAGVAE